MPYALADAWFEEKLNSVSISYWRQIMGKSRDGKKEEKHQGSPMTRSRRDQLSRTGSGGTGDKTKKDDAAKKEKTKLSGSVKGTAVGQSGDGAEGSTSKRSQDAIDIPSLLYDVERRVQKKQDFEKIAERMPLGNSDEYP